MATIDALEAQVTERKEQAQLLMQAVLREAFAGGEGAVESAAEPDAPTPVIRHQRSEKSTSGYKPAPEKTLPLTAEAVSAYRGKSTPVEPQQLNPSTARITSIPQCILTHMQPGRDYTRAEITAATGIKDTDWTWAVRQLKEQGRVVQKGEKRGARYVLGGSGVRQGGDGR